MPDCNYFKIGTANTFPTPCVDFYLFLSLRQGLSMWTSLVSNSQQCSCLSLPRAGIKGVHQHTMPLFQFLNNRFSNFLVTPDQKNQIAKACVKKVVLSELWELKCLSLIADSQKTVDSHIRKSHIAKVRPETPCHGCVWWCHVNEMVFKLSPLPCA